MVCVNTYSLVGEYVLDMHHIFSQQLAHFKNLEIRREDLLINIGRRIDSSLENANMFLASKVVASLAAAQSVRKLASKQGSLSSLIG